MSLAHIPVLGLVGQPIFWLPEPVTAGPMPLARTPIPIFRKPEPVPLNLVVVPIAVGQPRETAVRLPQPHFLGGAELVPQWKECEGLRQSLVIPT